MGIQRGVRIAAAAGAAFLAACAPAIQSQRDEAVPVPQDATWAWATSVEAVAPADSSGQEMAKPQERRAGPRTGDDPTGLREIPRQRFQRALEAALVAKGLRKVADPSEADFLLMLVFVGPRRPGPGLAVTGVSVGWYGGGGRWGRFQPWGGYGPWGGWMWQPWGFGWYGIPYWGWGMAPYPAGGPRGTTLVALLRQRSSGEVAWRAQYRADAYDLAYWTQRRAQEIADKLVATLR